MLNIEYYKDEILKRAEHRSTQCVIAELAGARCTEKSCERCEKLSFDWLCQEHEGSLLTNEEKKILSDLINALKPFISLEPKVEKKGSSQAYIFIYCDECVYTPSFDKDKMFTGLEYNKVYTLEDLGLIEQEDD